YLQKKWISTKWEFRRKKLFLIPGTSPIGLRLPLSSLSFEEEPEDAYPKDLFSPDGELHTYDDVVLQRKNAFTNHDAQPGAGLDESGFVRTALCVEVRKGKLCVFLPPLDHIEHYLDLLASVEATASELNIPVFIEGYTPPKDNRISQLSVTPDPGVIEVNIHPSKSWSELLANYKILYDQAFETRLGTEKFMLDGRHSGTGGGNHITIGGETPSDSPILRRPDVLRSLVTYWQHHPGLSYLFASEFVGPTSQAPRVDEGRDEKLYELEIAFSQIPDDGEVPFWLVDRLLRHLLVDITGNTHRAEFCIDKLYSPDSSTGRLGILELRAFDMPPHYRMSMVQMLLIRTLIAKFWVTPYKHKLVHWGTELHDKFMLSHYVQRDLQHVVNDLNDAGFEFHLSWFEPFFEFRFPFCGRTVVQDIEIELRKGIEPWHVLGEEVSRSGTARYVDSSLERMQVKITGLTDTRYVLLCNGNRIPLRNTGIQGEFVAGVRYKAWQPPSALHPTIEVDTPLIFDLLDTWNGKVVGGCTYFVAHPGGRSYDTFPVNANEAEARRVSRFWNYGHTIGGLETSPAIKSLEKFFESSKGFLNYKQTPDLKVNASYPHTLDLRLFYTPDFKRIKAMEKRE
ncbi:MAG TPA: transglutaminase family protein, partial [Cytophagaceae bacterium]